MILMFFGCTNGSSLKFLNKKLTKQIRQTCDEKQPRTDYCIKNR